METNRGDDEALVGKDRRAFMATATKLAGVLGVIGLTAGDARPASANEAEARMQLLDLAMRTGDIERAIEQYRDQAKLDDRELAALRSLTRNDLQQLASLRRKLDPLGTRMGKNAGANFF